MLWWCFTAMVFFTAISSQIPFFAPQLKTHLSNLFYKAAYLQIITCSFFCLINRQGKFLIQPGKRSSKTSEKSWPILKITPLWKKVVKKLKNLQLPTTNIPHSNWFVHIMAQGNWNSFCCFLWQKQTPFSFHF